MNILQELQKLSRGFQPRTAPVPLVWPGIGPVGHLSSDHGVYVNTAYRNPIASMLRDQAKIDLLAADVSNGRLPAEALLAAAKRVSDTTDAVRAIKKMRGAITSFNDVIDARGNGQYFDYFGVKASQTTVANNWSSFVRTAGVPAAASYSNIPGGGRMTSATTGAVPIPVTIGGSDHLYLTNAVANHVTGTNVHMYVDVLVSAGNILATSATSQNISTTSLSRWTSGEGLAMTLEVTAALGATAANITISYTDQAGNTANSTGAIALTTGAATGRLVPVQDGPMIRLATGDYGVRTIEGCILSASMTGSGVMAALIYKPLVVCPTMTLNLWNERSTPAQLSGIKQLTSAVGGELPFVGSFVLASTTSTGIILQWLEFVYS
jgi:hypothetical protein